MQTKAVQLTEDEIRATIKFHASQIYGNSHISDIERSERIERMKYLDKRLKEFNKVENTSDNVPLHNEDKKETGSW